MKNREFVMLAKDYDPVKHGCAGMMVSEKLDGMRALWLPETKGLAVGEVNFANRARDERDHICTGLWSRYGKVIHCPESFTESLPMSPLDGELWIDRGRFQGLMSIVKELRPGPGWESVKYMIFDAPGHQAFYTAGKVNNPNYTYTFSGVNPSKYNFDSYSFESLYNNLRRNYPHLNIHYQTMLPFHTKEAEEVLDKMMQSVIMNGGEGLMLRNPSSIWEPYRVPSLLKVKPYRDSEATVEGYTPGKGKYEGMLGALIVRWFNPMTNEIRVFELGTGLTDRERRHPESFPKGTIVTFRYRELSDNGTPKEGRFLRIRND